MGELWGQGVHGTWRALANIAAGHARGNMVYFPKIMGGGMMRNLVLAGLMAAACSPAHSATPTRPTPVTVDDINRMADVSEPSFSPDGTRIAYTVSKNDTQRNADSSEVWTVDWKGGPARQLTHSVKGSAWHPLWSADGRTIAFLSDVASSPVKASDRAKDPVTQLWTMPAAGGAARATSHIKGGISDFVLSPDGRKAVVVAEVGKAVGYESETEPPIEIDRFYFKQDERGYLDDRTTQLFLVDLKTDNATQLTNGARDHWLPSWSPDGKSIAFVGKDHGETDRTMNYDIYVVPASGGEPKRISTSAFAEGNPEWSSRPAWSADSRRLLWLESDEDKWIYYAPPQLTMADLDSGRISRIARIDRAFQKPQWSADGSILTLIEQDRDTWLARVDPGTGTISYLTRGARFASDLAVTRSGRIVLVEGTADKPAELRALDGDRTLTRHNGWLAGRALGEVRDVAFQSGDAEIHGMLTLPAGADPSTRYPLIVNLHGGPVYQHSHEFRLEDRIYAGAGYAVLAVNPHGSSGRGLDFARSIYADWGNLDAKDISAGISDAIEHGVADPQRIAVGGWSYGGILTDYMIASDSRIKAAVSGAGVANVLATFGADMYAREYLLELGTPWENMATYQRIAYPFLHPDRISAPTLFECAGADFNVPCVGAEQMYLALKTRGLPTRLIVYPGQNHAVRTPSYLVHRMRSNIAWYDLWLKPATRH